MDEVQEMTDQDNTPLFPDDPGFLDQLPEAPPMEFVYPEPLPEAGGVAWIDLYGQRFFEIDGKQIRKVFKISLTARSTSPIQALDKLKEAIDHAEQKYGLRPYPL